MDLRNLPLTAVDDSEEEEEEDIELTVEEMSELESESENRSVTYYGYTTESESEPESYKELAEEIHHPAHPNHPLRLYKETNSSDSCAACFGRLTTFSYRCDEPESECKFYIHVECSSLMPSIKHEEHHHLLTLIETSNEGRTCQNCSAGFDSLYARCLPCDINYHVRCGRKSLQTTTLYDVHDHPLFLSYTKVEGKVCDACQKELNPNPDHPVYNCEECGYTFHVRCVISEIQLDKREKLVHSCHDHVLFSCDDEEKDEASCRVCGNCVCVDETTLTYGCGPCSFYFHKTCIDKIPQEIVHEFHPHHPLTLCWQDSFFCGACFGKRSGFVYVCVETECEFVMELDCTLKKPSIQDERHHHLLTFFDKLDMTRQCNANCGFNSSDARFLRCVECDFDVHLLCSPLPRNIKFKGHLHSLALEDYLIEDDFGEYYCDHCEDQRDPKECVYHCAEGCPYVSEFNCVIDEVISSLNQKHKDVGLFRTVNRTAVNKYYYKMVTKGLYLHDVYKSSLEEELELEDLNTRAQTEFVTIVHKEYNLHFNFVPIDTVRWSRRHFPFLTVKRRSQVVKIGNYIITKKLENVFSQIHGKYSDIGDNCSLSEGSKTIVLIHYVQVIQEMLETKISNITEEVFLWWLFRIVFAGQAGFMVDFVFKHLNKVGDARFRIKNVFDRYPFLEDYYGNIKHIIKDIEERKARLVELKTEQEGLINQFSDKSLKEDLFQSLNNIDFSLERAGKGLL